MMTSMHILPAWRPVSLALALMALPLSAATFGKFTYEDGETITITGYTQSTTGPVAIPATINGKSVGKIGQNAFKGSGLSDVWIPEGVTHIDLFAFFQCANLKKVTIPSSVTLIGEGAFRACSHLTEAVFAGNAPKLETSVFAGAPAAFKVYFHKGSTGFTTPKWYGYPAFVLSLNPEITIKQPIGSNLVDGIAKRSFGTVKLGKSGKTKIFTIKNTGSANLLDLAITRDGNHAMDFIVTGPENSYLPPGASTTFKVKFKPTAKGTRKAAIHVKSNDKNENPFDIKLSGMGVK
jgi:hypothetical protein